MINIKTLFCIMALLSMPIWLSFASTDEVIWTINNWTISQWLEISIPCNPLTVSNGSVNSTTCEISCNAGYDKSWNSCIQQSSGGWGGGWWGSTTTSKDDCPNGDNSPNKYDGTCGTITTETDSEWTGTIGNWTSSDNTYSSELNEAYSFAAKEGITSMANIKEANMEWTLIRVHMAKMMVNYAINVLGKTIDATKLCVFSDMVNQTNEMKDYSIKACQLWIMGINTKKFMPNDIVTRAQFATVLSRVLRWDKYNSNWIDYYTNHIKALKDAKIISTTDPSLIELRWYVMLMLMRSHK